MDTSSVSAETATTPASLRDRYIALLKDTLSFSLWPEPLLPAKAMRSVQSWPRRMFVSLFSALSPFGFELARDRRYSESQRADGKIWPGYAHTMIGRKRLDNLHACVATAIEEGVPGDLIETGVWRGGASILMKGILAAYGEQRRVIVADSFEGLPPPDPDRFPADAGDRHHRHSDVLGVSRAEVEANFAKYGLLDDSVVFLEGFFEHTLPDAPVEQLAVLRLDGDLYQSTIEALDNLYPKLSPGGFCIIDDYGLASCRKAVDDYRRSHAIDEPLETIDWTGAFWRKAR